MNNHDVQGLLGQEKNSRFNAFLKQVQVSSKNGEGIRKCLWMGPSQSRSLYFFVNPISAIVFLGPSQCLCVCLKTPSSWYKKVYSQSACFGRLRAPMGMFLSPWAQEMSTGPWDLTAELRGPISVNSSIHHREGGWAGSVPTQGVYLLRPAPWRSIFQRPKLPRGIYLGVPCHNNKIWGGVFTKSFGEIFGFFLAYSPQRVKL